MTFTYPLPHDTQEKFAQRNQQCSNLSLLLDRYIGYKIERDDWKFQEEHKAELFRAIARQFQFPRDLIQHYYQRWQVMTQTLPYVEYFTASPEWRMVIGLGQTSILETSMCIDRITGIPLIPGSALKGLAVSYAMLCELKTTDRAEAENNPVFKAIFGSQHESGRVIFLDAVPTEAPKLEPDIMNNHYQEYYSDKSGKVAPTPYQNPVPVYFLTLGNKSQFAFAIASRDQQPDIKELVKQAKCWLQTGLSDLGIGGKTAAGYGYMS